MSRTTPRNFRNATTCNPWSRHIFDPATAHAAFDGHYSGDYRPHLFKTTDFGKSWIDLSAGLPARGHVNVVREDRFQPQSAVRRQRIRFFDLRSMAANRGRALMSGLPATTSDDVVVHPRDRGSRPRDARAKLLRARRHLAAAAVERRGARQERASVPATASDAVGRRQTNMAWRRRRTVSREESAGCDSQLPPEERGSGKVTLQVVDASGATVREFEAR